VQALIIVTIRLWYSSVFEEVSTTGSLKPDIEVSAPCKESVITISQNLGESIRLVCSMRGSIMLE
jgi:hypothetical protein